MKKTLLKIFCLFGLAFLGLTSFGSVKPHETHAETNNKITVSANENVIKGRSYYCYVNIENLEYIASLGVSVHYDSSVIEVDYTYKQVGCSLYDYSIKNDAVNYSFLFGTENSTTYRTTLFYFRYIVKSGAISTNSFFDVTINDAYDFSLNDLEIDGSRYYFNIQNPEVENKTCYMYGTSSVSTKIAEEFEVSYRFNTTQIATGTLEIYYDRDLFEYVSLTELAFLDNKLVDVNPNLESSISVSFLGTTYANNTNILSVRFRTKGNANTTSQISVSTSGLYDLEYNPYTCSVYNTNVTLTYDSSYDVNVPRMYLTSNYVGSTNQVSLMVNLSADSHLGAGDFTLTWDSTYLTYSSYTKKFSPSFFNVNDKNVANGQLKFSIISLTDITAATQVIEVLFNTPYVADDVTTTLSISGSGISDSMTNPIDLNYVNCSQVLFCHHVFSEWSTVTGPTCTDAGVEHRVCSICGAEETREVEPLGHHFEDEWTTDVEATCEHEGSKSHHCMDCDAIKDETVIPMTDHVAGTPVRENEVTATCSQDGSYDLVTYCSECGVLLSSEHVDVPKTEHSFSEWTVITQPTCTEVGSEYRICSFCGFEETHEITPLGHDWEEEWTIDVEATCEHEGSKSHHCSRCDAIADETIISKTDHVSGGEVISNYVSPTCTQNGSYDSVSYCEECGEVISSQHVVVPATGHEFGAWETLKEATYTESGLEHRVCSKCGFEETREIPRIDASPLFIFAVDSINVETDSLETTFNKIKQAYEYYNMIENKAAVISSYEKLQSAVNSYNEIVTSMNNNHEGVSDNTLVLALSISGGTSLLLLGLAILRKKVFKI